MYLELALGVGNLIFAELHGRKGYRCVEWWLKMYSCSRLLSVLQKDLAVLNTLQRYTEICKNVGYMDIYVLLRSRWGSTAKI